MIGYRSQVIEIKIIDLIGPVALDPPAKTLFKQPETYPDQRGCASPGLPRSDTILLLISDSVIWG